MVESARYKEEARFLEGVLYLRTKRGFSVGSDDIRSASDDELRKLIGMLKEGSPFISVKKDD